jgi:hypothetical protein
MNLEKNQIIKSAAIGLVPILIIVSIFFYITFKDPNFYIDDIPENLKKKIIMNGVWNQNCPVSLNRLKILNIKYYDKNGNVNRDGQFLVLDIVSDHALKIFKKLYKKKILIEKIDDILVYKSHKESRIGNVSMGFICDKDDDQNLLYSYGLAFDINPLYNPALNYVVDSSSDYAFIQVNNISKNFINRRTNFPMKNEDVVDIFRANGFSIWGGNWLQDINWQYFSIEKNIATLLFLMKEEDARKFFDLLVDNIKFIDRFKKENFMIEIKYLYQKDERKFLKIFEKNIGKLKNLSDSQFFDILRKKINN